MKAPLGPQLLSRSSQSGQELIWWSQGAGSLLPNGSDLNPTRPSPQEGKLGSRRMGVSCLPLTLAYRTPRKMLEAGRKRLCL